MGDFHKYEALEGSVKMEDITRDEGNADILCRLSANDSDFTDMWLQQDPEDQYDFRPTTAKETGWLGYFLGKSTQLKSFNILHSNLGDWNDTIEPICNGLSRNKSIKSIHMGNVDLSGGEIFGMMQPFFENNPSLIDLNIQRCNNFGIEGCRLLSVALGSRASKTMQDVSITGNGIEDGQLVDIIVALSTHPHLETLKLSDNQMGRNTCMALATLVQWTATELSELNLADNSIGDEGIELLAPALSNSASLKKLFLSSIGISSKGIEYLSTLLKSSNCELEVLALGRNQIGDDGAKILAPSLAKSTSLKRLFLSSNDISPKGIQALSSVLQSSRSNLVELYLTRNLIGDDGAKILASSLANNVSLECLGLSETNITDEGWTAFANLLCDSSSVNKTYLSNHTLECIDLGTPINRSSFFTRDVTPFLNYNEEGSEEGDKEKVAVKKIIKTHKDINMQPFFEWDMKVLPIAFKWFDNAISMAGIAIQQRKLSTIYQFIRGMPLLYIKGCLKRELSEMQHEDMIVR